MRRVLVLLLVNLAVSWALFGPCLDVPFIQDDLSAAAAFHPEGELDWGAVATYAWPGPERTFNHHFRPLGLLTVAVTDAVFGFRPEAFRGVAITLHGVLGFIVSLLFLALIRADAVAAALAGTVFVAHPGTYETIIWVAHVFTLAAGLFYALAALAAVRFARSGRGLAWLAVAASAAILSKDSMVSILLTLPLLVFVVSTSDVRLPRGLRAGLVVGAIIVADLILRRLATGAFLPGVAPDGSVIETANFAERAVGAGRFVTAMAAPVTLFDHDASWWSTFRFVTLGVAAASALLGVVDAVRRRAPWSAVILLLGILACMLPVLSVGEQFQASRRFYVPMVAGALCMGTSRWGRWTLLAVFALYAVGTWKNLQIYDEIRTCVSDTRGHVEAALPSGDPVIVVGLPRNWKGIEVFGYGHFRFRFQPPLSDRPQDVYAVQDAVDLDRHLQRLRPRDVRLLFLEERPNASDELIALRHSVRVPGSAMPPGGLVPIRPMPGGTWPQGGGIEVEWETPASERPSHVRIVILVGENRYEIGVPSTDPSLTWTPTSSGYRVTARIGSAVGPFLMTPELIPGVLAAIQRSASATMWIEELSGDTTRSTPPLAITLRGGG